MCAAPLLYIPGGLIVLLAECLACCLSTLYTETVLPKTADRLLEKQLYKLFQRTFLRKILTYMQTACTKSSRLQNSVNTLRKNTKPCYFYGNGGHSRVQVQRDFSKQPTYFTYMFFC